MGNRTPIIVLPVASASNSYSSHINASIILMPDGLIPDEIYQAAAVAQSVRASVRLTACGRSGTRVRISAACNRP